MEHKELIAILTLVSSLIGGVIVAVVSHLLSSKKTAAEVTKLEAETRKLHAEADNIEATITDAANTNDELIQEAPDSFTRDLTSATTYSVDEDYFTRLAENWPDLAIEEAWRLIEAELEVLAHRYNVPNTRNSVAFWQVAHEIFHSEDLNIFPAWVARMHLQIRRLRRAVRDVHAETLPKEKALALALQALSFARILSNFEAYKDWHKQGK